MKRALQWIAILAGVQMALVGVYLLAREDPGGGGAGAERLAGAAPAFAFERVGGERADLASLRGRPVVVHFWATWCPPCREELPALLEYATSGAGDARVLAVSTDPDWEAVRGFLGGELPPAVVRATPEAARAAFGVRSLPETIVVGSGGRLRLRFDGPRDWSADAVREAVAAVD